MSRLRPNAAANEPRFPALAAPPARRSRGGAGIAAVTSPLDPAAPAMPPANGKHDEQLIKTIKKRMRTNASAIPRKMRIEPEAIPPFNRQAGRNLHVRDDNFEVRITSLLRVMLMNCNANATPMWVNVSTQLELGRDVVAPNPRQEVIGLAPYPKGGLD
jgi:hypothetical protein